MAKNNVQQGCRGGICVSIAGAGLDEALGVMAANAGVADLFEIRLDTLARPEISPFLAAATRPLLFTCRPRWEGGSFAGDEEARAALLEEAARSGAALIDIELRADPAMRQRLLAAARESGCAVIVSWHDFHSTPAAGELARIVAEMRASGGDIGKIVTTAHNRDDVLAVLDLYRQAGSLPLCAFAMGKPGAISRLAVLPLGGCITYAAPAGGVATAAGQLPAAVMRNVLPFLTDAD
ncbi:MAG: type I 3-dehydroquinate dehydratase [Thermodesulfobacteriota bacterium]